MHKEPGDFAVYDVGENLDPIELFWDDGYGNARDLTAWTGLVRIGNEDQPAIIEKTTGVVGLPGDPSARITFTTTELSPIKGRTLHMLIRFTFPGLGNLDWKHGNVLIHVKPIILAPV